MSGSRWLYNFYAGWGDGIHRPSSGHNNIFILPPDYDAQIDRC